MVKEMFERRPFLLPLLILIFVICTFEYFEVFIPFYGSELVEHEGKRVEINGIIDEVKTSEEDFSRYEIIINYLKADNTNFRISERSSLTVRGNSRLSPGDKIYFSDIVNLPDENTNKGLFDYRNYLKSNNIYTMFSLNSSQVYLIGKSDDLKYKIRNSFTEYVKELFDEALNEENSNLMKTVLLADYDYMDEEDLDMYKDLNLTHLLSVSGLHIGIIAGITTFILSRFGVKRGILTVIVLSLLWAYAFVLGFPAPVFRAGIMTTLMMVAFLLKEPYDMENACYFSALIILTVNPYQLLSVSFQLTFVATLSISLLYKSVYDVLYPLPKMFRESIALITTVQIGLFPVYVYYFNVFNIISFVSNFVITPIFSLGLWLGSFLVIGGFFGSAFVQFIGFFLNNLLELIDFSVSIFDTFTLFTTNISSPDFIGIVCYFMVVLILTNLRNFYEIDNKLIKVVVIYFIVIIASDFAIRIIDRENVYISMIDVGQGESILINTDNKYYLVDTGGEIMNPEITARRITAPYLAHRGIDELDGVFLSHFDADHAGGVKEIIKRFRINRYFIPFKDNSVGFNNIIDSNVPYLLLTSGDIINLSEFVKIRVISPNKSMAEYSKNTNNLSLVFVLYYKDIKVLFTGDMEEEQELTLPTDYIRNIQILKVGHHGSETSTSKEFLNTVNPKLALISAGRNNMFGHPHDSVIESLHDKNTHILRTDRDGEINIILTKNGISYNTFYPKEKTLPYIYIIALTAITAIERKWFKDYLNSTTANRIGS